MLAPRGWWLAVALSLLALPVQADPPPPERIPDVLEPWIPWVLEDLGEDACPQVDETRTCEWPSALDLVVNDAGGTFTLRITTDRRFSPNLPGSIEHWPEDVRVDGKPAPVLERDDAPEVVLERGSHVVTGRFSWSEVPDSLATPETLALLTLTVNGQRVTFPKREADGLVWLHRGGGREEEADRLELTVHRKLADGAPLLVTTRIQVSASGRGREVILPRVLVPGTRPIQLDADVPAQLELDGTLRLQAQAGDHRIEITAVRETPIDKLSAPKLAAPWPENEIWVWLPDERLRHAELDGVAQIDPARTDLAQDWLGMPTYVVPAGQSLAITTRRRGEPEPAPNQVNLSRALWLDLDGDGYTVRDRLSGTLNRSFRLDLEKGELGHAVVGGQDQLITLHDAKPGVELRSSALELSTEWRLPHGRGTLPAVGYSEDVQSLDAQLHLPPGFMLLGTQGVDQASGTWLEQWDLFDFFFVLLVSLAVAKLAGRGFGVVALLALVLTHHEDDAPAVAWIFLLATTALLQVVSARFRFEKWVRVAWIASLVGLLLVAIPFAVQQVRAALYPHLAGESEMGVQLERYSMAMVQEEKAVEAPQNAAAPSAPAPERADEAQFAEDVAQEDSEGGRGKRADSDDWFDGISKGGSGYGEYGGVQKNVYARSEVDANAVVQTGPGVPTWSFRSHQLNWSGPVEKSQEITLWVAPPPVTRLWSLLNVLLSGVLLFALAMAARRKTGGFSEPPPAAAAAAVMALLLLVPASSRAQEIPPADVLETLKQRLVRPAECEPDCLSVEKLELSVEGARLVLRASVHAGTTTAYKAPGPLESWAPDVLKVDGQPALAANPFDDNFLRVRLTPGLHAVELSGPLPASQALTLALGDAPHRVSARATGWVVEGLRDDGRAEDSLVLRREVEIDENGEERTQALAQWLSVTREFDLGVRFRVRTTITRLSPASESLLVKLPLLPGESVLDSGVTSDGKSATVELSRDEDTATLNTTLGVTKELALSAALPSAPNQTAITRPWNETWVVRCSALYHCSFDGLAPVSRSGDDGMLAFTYKPWPGEALKVRAERLDAAKGTSVTIDGAELNITPGSRMEQAALTLNVRTSRGTTERIQLPQPSTLTSLKVDGTPRPARLVKGALEVALDPGSHRIEIGLQAPRGMTFSYSSSPYSLNRAAVNVTSVIHVPQDRWLLYAYGPSWGPAVLFWGYLLVVLLGAIALSQVPHTPLRPQEWVLLGLGLTQVEVPVVIVIVGWLFVLSLRERTVVERRWAFNLLQVLIAGFTLFALGCLAYAVHRGLVVQPDMQVQGMGSSNTELRWYIDRTSGALPTVGLFSLPLWIYKALMLVWALWLAASLIRWLRWGFRAFRSGGTWRSAPPKPPTNPRVPPEEIAAAQAALDAANKNEG
jgi:hypothetical protein